MTVDNYRTGGRVAEIFHRHGHRSVAVIQPVYRQISMTIAQRNSGFLENCRKLGMDAAVVTGRPGELYSNKIGEGRARQSKCWRRAPFQHLYSYSMT